MRICIKCFYEKDESEFFRNLTVCKKCKNEQARERRKQLYLKNLEKINKTEITGTKFCSACQKIKSTDDFYVDLYQKDLFRPRCKECESFAAKYKRLTDENYREKSKEQKKIYCINNEEKVRETKRKYNQSVFGKILNSEYSRATRKFNKQKTQARLELAVALKSGEIKKPDNCSQCKKECQVEGHHHDYDKPLDVIWLCRSCHIKLHVKERLLSNVTNESIPVDKSRHSSS